MPPLYLYGPEARAYAQQLHASAGRDDVLLHPLADEKALEALAPEPGTHLIVSGTIETIKSVLLFARQHDLSVGIIPLPDQNRLQKVLALPKQPVEMFEAAARPSTRRVDLMLCNDTPVLSDVRIGENSLLKAYEFEPEELDWRARLRRQLHVWREKTKLRHHRFSVTTDKEETLTFSATGLIALHYDNNSWVAHTLRSELSAIDGQLAVLVLAPRSLFEFFIAYPLRMAWRRWRRTSALPSTWGYLKSTRVSVETPEEIEVVIDDSQTVTTPVNLRVEPDALLLSVGEAFWSGQESVAKSTRNAIRISGVPREEEQMAYFQKGLPLFPHASQEEYAALFGTLREETQLGWTFVVLLILSTVLATLGLFINSASVIIGAMLLAPLMQPIVGLSMGVLRRDTGLLWSGARSIGVGVGLVLGSAMTIAWLTPMHELGSEMAARLSPTILDMLVAIVSGIAAAYAKNNPKISGSLVGVAIAVALVPPLSVSGIGIGWGSWPMFSNAMLLFLTNLVGIVFAASLTFFVLGFSPLRIAKRGILLWGIVAAVVAVPLYQSFDRMRTTSQIRQALSGVAFDYGGQHMTIGRVEYFPGNAQAEVRCDVVVDRPMKRSERAYLREMIRHIVGRSVDVVVTVRYRL
jgi:uncharacterized hydrophobic protein (TIGR00271 family)